MHVPALIRDLSIVLAIAASVSVLFHRIRQPVVLGYICSGLLATLAAGPFSSDLSVLADLGLIFLMFSLGLEFSFRKVMRLGAPVAFAALFEVGAILTTGTLVASWLGWTGRAAWMVGAMTAISSTTIIVKALEEVGLKNRGFARQVLGILVFEDLMAILVLVFFSGSAGWIESASSLLLFVGGWFLFGTFVLPRVLRRIGSSGSDEMIMVVSVALCLGLGMAATSLGYSPGLGAFLMGSILAESSESHRIERLVQPLRDLFVAVFFVTMGMLIEPSAIWQHRTVILVLSAHVVLAKLLFGTLGPVLSGKRLKTSVLIGGSLTQIGEFSLIMAGLAVASKALDASITPIIISVSVITTLLTPYSIRLAPKVFQLAEKLLPLRLQATIQAYSDWSEKRASRSTGHSAQRDAYLRWALPGFIVVLLGRLAAPYASPWTGAGVAALALPFLWSFLRGVRLDPPSPLHKWATQASALLICGLLAWPYFRGTPVIWGLALALVLVTVRLAGRLGDLFKWFERNFVASLSPVSHESTAPARPSIMSRLAPWENELVKLVLHADSEFAGKSILSASLRNRHGINIVAIQRGSRLLVAPQPTELLLPGDEILVLAAEEALDQARPLIEQGGQLGDSGTLLEAYELRAIEVSADSPCARKTIRESGIRDRYQALVVGIEREGKRITNPDSDLTIRPGDLLWIVAESPRIDQMGQEMRQAMG